MEDPFVEVRGFGEMKFVLGHGPGATAGHVELWLRTLPEKGQCKVLWGVEGHDFDADARVRVEKAAGEYLEDYVATHPEIGLAVTVTAVSSAPDRINEYERVVFWAMHGDLSEAGLPLPQIFMAPDEDDSWQEPLA